MSEPDPESFKGLVRHVLTRFFDFAFDLQNFIVIMGYLLIMAFLFHSEIAQYISQCIGRGPIN